METQPAPGGRPPDEHLRLGQYLVGALPAVEREAFETHLARCRECLAETERLEPMLTMLALVPPDEAHALVAAFAPPEVPGTPPRAVNARTAPPETPVSIVRTGPVRPTGHRDAPNPTPERPRGGTAPARSSRGAARSPAGRPKGGTRPKRGRRGGILIGALALLLVVSGLGVAWSILRDGGGSGSGVTLAATGADTTSGVSLSVRVVGNGHTSTVSATVGGLPAGQRHQLFAVDAAGESFLLSDWTAAAGVQEITGECAAPVDRLAFFSVTTLENRVLVIAHVNRPAGSGQPVSPR